MGHHYVPQKYLQGFSTPDDPLMIWQFDKKLLEFSQTRASIKKIAQQREFYTPDVERQLADQIEKPANAIIDRLRGGEPFCSLRDEERAQWAVYVATMMFRVPRHRHRAAEIMPKALASVVSRLKHDLQQAAAMANLPEQVVNERLQSRLAEVDEIHERFLETPPPQIVEQVRTPWPSDQVIALIYSHNWYIVEAGGRSRFVTSDSPAFMFDCYGLKNPDSEITFPISTELALFGTRRPVRRLLRPLRDEKLVREANRRIISAATRFVYSRERWEWIMLVAQKTSPYLSRIM